MLDTLQPRAARHRKRRVPSLLLSGGGAPFAGWCHGESLATDQLATLAQDTCVAGNVPVVEACHCSGLTSNIATSSEARPWSVHWGHVMSSTATILLGHLLAGLGWQANRVTQAGVCACAQNAACNKKQQQEEVQNAQQFVKQEKRESTHTGERD
jgi:hypothetical protein